jgi:hypothetical protein
MVKRKRQPVVRAEREDETYAHAKQRAFLRYGVSGSAFCALHTALVARIQAKQSWPIADPANSKTRHWHAVLYESTLYVVLYSGTFQGLVTFAAPGSEVYAKGVQLCGQPNANQPGLYLTPTRA